MIEGVRVGHWTDAEARTGCTVVLLPEGTVASAEVRGGAPATRELELLRPECLVARLDAVVMTGGSAFGLAAADGVMAWCEREGRGFPTGAGPVPIVAAMALFDLAVGDASVRPGPAQGWAACEGATEGPVTAGPVGAGCGATVGKRHPPPRPAGLGAHVVADGGLAVGALAAVNAYGDVGPPDLDPEPTAGAAFANTTLVTVVTNARLDKVGCLVVAQGGHDGMARALWPPHTRVDGDVVVAAATGRVEADVDRVRLLAVAAVEEAIRKGAPGS